MATVRAVWLLCLAGLAWAGTQAQPKPEPSPGSGPCADCHEAGRRTGQREPGFPVPFEAAALRGSRHAAIECNSCHADLAGKQLPHPEKLAPVDCGLCHSDQGEQFAASLHGKAVRRGDRLAPSCKDCHGTHNVLWSSDPRSTIGARVDCSICHSAVVNEYRESTHGELFAQGGPDAPSCADCHGTHGTPGKNETRSPTGEDETDGQESLVAVDRGGHVEHPAGHHPGKEERRHDVAREPLSISPLPWMLSE